MAFLQGSRFVRPKRSLYDEQRQIMVLAGEIKEMFREGLPFLDHYGNLVSELEGENNRAIEIYTKRALGCATMIAEESAFRLRTLRERLDSKRESGKIRKISRIKKAISDEEKRPQFFLEYYRMFAPATSCFIPFVRTEDTNKLGCILDQMLETDRYTRNDRGWLSGKYAEIPSQGNIFSRVKSYLSVKERLLKLKFTSFHKGDSVNGDDKLDVEIQFDGSRFEGLVHYHVDKPYTIKRLIESRGAKLDIPYSTEMSRNPRTGNSWFAMSKLEGGMSDRNRFHQDQARDTLMGFDFWNKYPVVAGGALLETAIDLVRENPRFEALQNWALRQNK